MNDKKKKTLYLNCITKKSQLLKKNHNISLTREYQSRLDIGYLVSMRINQGF